MLKETKVKGDFVPFMYLGVAVHEDSCVGSDARNAIAIADAFDAVGYSKNGVAIAQEQGARAHACSSKAAAIAQAGGAINPEGVAIAIPSKYTSAYAEGRYVIAVGEQAYGEVKYGQIGLALQGAWMKAQDGAFVIIENGVSPSLVEMAPRATVHIVSTTGISKVHVGDYQLPVIGCWGDEWRSFADKESALITWREWMEN